MAESPESQIMTENLQYEILKSWADEEGSVSSNDSILEWIKELNSTTRVQIKECSIYESSFWFYDDYNGEVLNRKRSFFSITGMRYFEDNEFIKEQPVILQPEIGYLGIICKKINGILHFLMQAKTEPGNVNCVQISPTIQATKSNFMRVHGGRLPAYFEYFENSGRYHVIYDQVQSEQASRFYKKRNRNMIMYVDEEIDVLPNFKWMTLGQIKLFMKTDNLVNMDTRTVLSGLPVYGNDGTGTDTGRLKGFFYDSCLFRSMLLENPHKDLADVFRKLNNYKMFRDAAAEPVPLNHLVDWNVDEYGITCRKPADFSVRYYDIEISGREVQHWIQPLFKASGPATFGLLTKAENGVRKYLVQAKPEIGSFDRIELGPSVQWEPSHAPSADNAADRLFRKCLDSRKGFVLDVVLSEEGGRFYHEQNRNIILDITGSEEPVLPDTYLWVSYSCLNYMVQMHNCLNIQLRNLLSLIRL